MAHGPAATCAAVLTFDGAVPGVAGLLVPAQTTSSPECPQAPFMKVGCGVYMLPNAHPCGLAPCSAIISVLLSPSLISAKRVPWFEVRMARLPWVPGNGPLTPGNKAVQTALLLFDRVTAM